MRVQEKALASRKRILHRRSKLYGDGVTALQMNWAEALKDEFQFDFWLIEPIQNEYTKFFCDSGSQVWYQDTIQGNRITRKINTYKYYINFLKQHKYDAIHFNTDTFLILDVLLCAKIAGVKKRIVHCHNGMAASGLGGKWKLPIFQVLGREWIWNLSTDRVACSSEAARWLFPKRKQKRVKIIFNGIPVEKYFFNENARAVIREKCGLQDKFVIGTVGRLSEQKNLFYLLDIFSKIHSVRSDAYLMMVGEGELHSELKLYAEKLKINDRIIFVGKTNNVEAYLSSMDCFVLTSLFEGLPLALIEAQSSGLPCICSDRVTQEVKICDLVEFLPIGEENIDEWSQKIICTLNKDRNKYNCVCQESKFNIVNSIHDLADIYGTEE